MADTAEQQAQRLEEMASDLTQFGLPEKDQAIMRKAAAALRALQVVAASEKNEATAYPWWCVVRRGGLGTFRVFAGPFFSREAAEQHRKAREYDYGAKSFVFCFSGHYSQDYRALYSASLKLREGGQR